MNSRTFPLSNRPAQRSGSVAAEQRIRLNAGECWTPQTARPTTLLCATGSFWWTQAGDARDHLLRPGQQLTVTARDRVVVQALHDGELVVKNAA